MKVHVITDAEGNIVGTVHPDPGSRGDLPAAPTPLDGQQVHEVELPEDLRGNRNPDQLHERVRNLLRS